MMDLYLKTYRCSDENKSKENDPFKIQMKTSRVK